MARPHPYAKRNPASATLWGTNGSAAEPRTESPTAAATDLVRPSGDTSSSRAGLVDPPSHLTRQSLAAWHFARIVGDRVRYDHGRRRWLLWSGHRWRPDEDGAVRRLWLDVLASRYAQALKADEHVKPRLLADVQQAGALNSSITAGLAIAASMEPLATTGDAWDRDPFVLGCENGVVDLRTGLLRRGRPEEMISRSTGVVYDPDATCPRWQRFLAEVFAGDSELAEWYGLLIGMSLIGVPHELLAIHHGLGNNGKSVAVQTLRHVAGDYAVVIPIETLVSARRSAGEATPDLMPLRGARIAFTSEPDQAAKLRGGVLKRLASIDRMTGRYLYGASETWEPTHTVHLGTNHLPAVDDATEGFWRRVALIPWPVQFRKLGGMGDGPPEDPSLASTLLAEAPGILTWAVGGAVAFTEGRALHPFPESVRSRTATYRADEDRLGGFIRDRVVYELGASVRVGVLFTAYQGWCQEQDLPPIERLSMKRFAREFAERGQGVDRSPDATNRVVFIHARLRVRTDPVDPDHSTPSDGGTP